MVKIDIIPSFDHPPQHFSKSASKLLQRGVNIFVVTKKLIPNQLGTYVLAPVLGHAGHFKMVVILVYTCPFDFVTLSYVLPSHKQVYYSIFLNSFIINIVLINEAISFDIKVQEPLVPIAIKDIISRNNSLSIRTLVTRLLVIIKVRNTISKRVSQQEP